MPIKPETPREMPPYNVPSTLPSLAKIKRGAIVTGRPHWFSISGPGPNLPIVHLEGEGQDQRHTESYLCYVHNINIKGVKGIMPSEGVTHNHRLLILADPKFFHGSSRQYLEAVILRESCDGLRDETRPNILISLSTQQMVSKSLGTSDRELIIESPIAQRDYEEIDGLQMETKETLYKFMVNPGVKILGFPNIKLDVMKRR